MTKTQIEQLNIDVAVIKNDISNLKNDAKSMKSLLRWFIVLCVMIMGMFVANWILDTGNQKTMKQTLTRTNKIMADMAAQGAEAGWYKPSPEAIRGEDDDKN